LKKTSKNGFYIPTNEIKIFSNKIYCFQFKFGKNHNFFEYTYISRDHPIIKIEDEEDLCIYAHSPGLMFFIIGFYYKMNLNI